jgi:hypothetical protein
MVAQVVITHYPSGEPAAVAPTRIPLAAREDKDANGLTAYSSQSVLGGRLSEPSASSLPFAFTQEMGSGSIAIGAGAAELRSCRRF